jgi:hypothetical protein
MADLLAVHKLATLGLKIAFLDVRRQGPSFLVGPAFLRILSFESAAQYIFNICVLRRKGVS